MSSFQPAARGYVIRLDFAVVPLHNVVEHDGRMLCSCIHKPRRDDPSKCGCGHVRATQSSPCSCGRRDCPVHCNGKPCSQIGKHPRTRHGVLDATKDLDVIARWAERWPNANIAIALGKDEPAERKNGEPERRRSNVFAFDLDRHGAEQDGVEAFHDLCAEISVTMPDTPIQLTPSKGLHILFRDSAELAIKNRTGKQALRDGIEVKATGGYIVVAPSRTPKGVYAWESDCHPLSTPIRECPKPLLDLIVEHSRHRRPRAIGPTTGAAATCFLARAFDIAGWLGVALADGKVAVRCPWLHEHSEPRTGDGNDSSCVILAPTSERPLGQFVCSHGHCRGRGNIAALHALPSSAIALLADADSSGFGLACSLLQRQRAA